MTSGILSVSGILGAGPGGSPRRTGFAPRVATRPAHRAVGGRAAFSAVAAAASATGATPKQVLNRFAMIFSDPNEGQYLVLEEGCESALIFLKIHIKQLNEYGTEPMEIWIPFS